MADMIGLYADNIECMKKALSHMACCVCYVVNTADDGCLVCGRLRVSSAEWFVDV